MVLETLHSLRFWGRFDESVPVSPRAFFRLIDGHASPLTDELYQAIEARHRELNRLDEQDSENKKRFSATTGIKQWSGLVHVAAKTAMEQQKRAFMDEWFSTLQILRDIGVRISADQYRPAWIPKDRPSGAQADQFLHAHYYNRVIGSDRRSRYAEMFEMNKDNPEGALQAAMHWWKSLPAPPSKEDRMLFEWAPFLRKELASAKNWRMRKFSILARRILKQSVNEYGPYRTMPAGCPTTH